MNQTDKNKKLNAILVMMGFAVLFFFNLYNVNPVYAADTSGSDISASLDKIYQKIGQFGFTEDTLADLKKVEDRICKKGANNTLSDVQRCYYGYVYNLIYLNKQKEAGAVMNSWSKALELVYQAEEDVTYEYLLDLKLKSDRFFDTGILLGPEYDQLLLNHTKNLADFFEKRTEVDPDLSQFCLLLGLESLSYAQLYNQKFVDYDQTVLKILSIKDQPSGELLLPENCTPLAAYKYLLEGNYQKCEEIIKHVIAVLGNTKDPINERTGTNELIDELYQMKKRNIAGKNIDKLLKELPEPILNITGVNANSPADKSGVMKGDRINKYQGVKCLSFDHFMDLVAAHVGESKIELELIRDNKTIVLTIPSGRIGITIAEDIKK